MNIFRIVGVLAMLWGGGVVVWSVLKSAVFSAGGSSGFGSFPLIPLASGLLLFLAGLYATITGGRKKTEE